MSERHRWHPRANRKALWNVDQAARALDRQPLARVVVIGIVLGLGIGKPGCFFLRSPAWLLFWGVLFVGLWRIAYSAEPVFEEDNPIAVETKPQRVRDGPLVMGDLPGGQLLMGSPDTDEMARDNDGSIDSLAFYRRVSAGFSRRYVQTHKCVRQTDILYICCLLVQCGNSSNP